MIENQGGSIMADISVGHCNISNIINDTKSGRIKIPQFQRQFVWSVESSAKLMDSILKGYPVGSLIFWKTKEHLRTVRNVGDFVFPNVPDGDFALYVLDGQQRITSIIASITGQIIGEEDYSQIHVDLTASEDEEIVIVDTDGKVGSDYISLKELYNPDLASIVDKYSNHIDTIQKYMERLKSYEFSKIDLSDAELDVATDVFTRINTEGKALTVFEIMCAKMYSENPEFDLYDKRQEQIQKWKERSYDTISDVTVLQAISICLCKDCKKQTILSLDKNKFIEIWDDVDKAFDMTIDYFKSTFGIPVSRLIPYDALIVPFVYFFYKNKNNPSGEKQQYLKDYFWRSSFSQRFTEGAVSKTIQDVSNVIDVILAGKRPEYEQGLIISHDTIKREGLFSVGSAYIKAILCILCSKKPVSFKDGHEVIIDNSWLSQGNSKNYHHFFPKDYMKKKQPLIPDNLVNHIVNITIVDGWLNKTVIKAKAPSEYMREFEKENGEIKEHMKTHLIMDLDEFGVFEDDYNTFFEHRIKKIHEEMISRIVPRENDVLLFKSEKEEE